jgi:enoyl-CoA hydratase/carnithine racemase
MRGAVLWLTINREERRNAISPGVLAGLIER